MELRAAGYRSLRNVTLPVGRVTVVVGANGAGKTNLYRALRLLAASARGRLTREIVAEGGMPAALWAGPRPYKKPVRLTLGVTFADGFSYELAAGLKVPGTPFPLDPDLKEEALWHGRRRPSTTVLSGKNGHVTLADDPAGADSQGRGTQNGTLEPGETALSQLRDAALCPELAAVRAAVTGWRFYHDFPAHADAPARRPHVATFTPVLAEDAADLPAALATIRAVGDWGRLTGALAAAFPDAEILLEREREHWLAAAMGVPGLNRPLTAGEFSDGTLRFLCLAAALLSPRPAPLVVLNEPETSLHPALLPALAELIAAASAESQVWVTTHAAALADDAAAAAGVVPVVIDRRDGATVLRRG